jgi:hypothetical protein
VSLGVRLLIGVAVGAVIYFGWELLVTMRAVNTATRVAARYIGTTVPPEPDPVPRIVAAVAASASTILLIGGLE